MATAVVESPRNATRSSSADQERQFTNELQQREVDPTPGPVAEALQATREMCAYCFGRSALSLWLFLVGAGGGGGRLKSCGALSLCRFKETANCRIILPLLYETRDRLAQCYSSE